jgi:uncharacterized protein
VDSTFNLSAAGESGGSHNNSSSGKSSRAPVRDSIKGYYQLIEGHDGGFMFGLRAGNHETILESRVFWSRQAALEGVDQLRALSADTERFVRCEPEPGKHFFEVRDSTGRMLARGPTCTSRASLGAGIASVQRNAAATRFRGLVRRTLLSG